MYETLEVERKAGFVVVWLNRPDKLNALNAQMLQELQDLFVNIANDASVYAVILSGRGKAFAAGADIAELHRLNADTGESFAHRGQGVMNAIEQCGKPVIAAVNGYALGGGCELALACHLRFASTKAKFGQPEVNLGIIPGYGGTQRLPRVVGVAIALEMILSGEMIDAEQAARIGLVNRVYPPEQLMEATERFVQLLLQKGQAAIQAALRAVLAARELSLSDGLQFEARAFGQLCGTPDFLEGTAAFLEKRQPRFQHQ